MEISEIISSLTNSAASQTEQRLADDFDTFLTLLTTQLQQQDPLDPLDSNQFTEQLVSFTHVEQSIQTNKNLENLLALFLMQSTTTAVGYLGKEVSAEGNTAVLKDGEATWFYELGALADEATLTVKDSAGARVFEADAANLPGLHSFTWDGNDKFGTPLPDGVYTISVSAETSGGNEVAVTTFTRGTVEAVETQGGLSLLSVGGVLIPVTDVLAVSEPEPASENP